MLKLDNHIKSLYNKYFTLNPKEFLDVYEIILVSEHDEMEIERAYFYVDVYTNCVIAGHYASD